MNRNTTVSSNRTENIKFVTYGGDGSGRDQHIIFGSGGLCFHPFRPGAQKRDDYDVNGKVV